MTLEWYQIAVAVVGAAYVAWKKRDAIKGALGGVLPVSKPTDKTLSRVEAWQQLVSLCEGDCPQAIKLLDDLFPHLRPGHTHEVAK